MSKDNPRPPAQRLENRLSPDPWKVPGFADRVHRGELVALRAVLDDEAFEQLLRQRRAGIFMGRADAEAARLSLEAWEGADGSIDS